MSAVPPEGKGEFSEASESMHGLAVTCRTHGSDRETRLLVRPSAWWFGQGSSLTEMETLFSP